MRLKSWTCAGCQHIEKRIAKDGLADYCAFTVGDQVEHRTEWHGDLCTCLDKVTANDDIIRCHDADDLTAMCRELNKGIWQEITEGDCSGYDPTLAGYDDPVVGYVCSCCIDGYEKEVMGDTLFNFCSNCGADMRGEEDETD